MLLANVPFIPEIFLRYFQEETAEKSAFIQSGIMATSPQISEEFNKGGQTITLPFFGDLSGADVVRSDTVALVPANLTGGSQVGVRLQRDRAWQASDLASELAGEDAMQAIARSTARYWIRRNQAVLIEIAGALFKAGGALLATHDSGDSDTPVSGTGIIRALAKLGDAGSTLTGISMHSAMYYYLLELDVFDKTTQQANNGIERASMQMLEVASYMGRPVFVDDTLPYAASGGGAGGATDRPVVSAYLFGPGAFGYAMAPAKTPVETDRNSLLGVDYLVNRMDFLVHPNGMRWVGTPAAASPTNTELGTAANWAKVFSDDKNIRFVRYTGFIPA